MSLNQNLLTDALSFLKFISSSHAEPNIVMVDECTTGELCFHPTVFMLQFSTKLTILFLLAGMDPGARHLVWRVLKPDDEDGVELPGTWHCCDGAANKKVARYLNHPLLLHSNPPVDSLHGRSGTTGRPDSNLH